MCGYSGASAPSCDWLPSVVVRRSVKGTSRLKKSSSVINRVAIYLYERGVSPDCKHLSSTRFHAQRARRRHESFGSSQAHPICFKLISLNSPSPLMRLLHVAPPRMPPCYFGSGPAVGCSGFLLATSMRAILSRRRLGVR
jgi:hypothetical protein